MSWHDLWVGVVVNIASAVAIGLAGFAWYQMARRRRLAFFGLGGDADRVVVYASRLCIPRWTSLGPDSSRRSFEGVATPEYEAIKVADIQGFFGGLGRVWRTTGLRWGDIQVKALIAPAAREDVDREATLITIGSPGYNVVSEMVEEQSDTLVRFANDNNNLAKRDKTVVGGADACFVQRLVSPATGQTIFWLAGPTKDGTTAAVDYLLRNWRKLSRRYRRDRSFCEVLRRTRSGYYVLMEQFPTTEQRRVRGLASRSTPEDG